MLWVCVFVIWLVWCLVRLSWMCMVIIGCIWWVRVVRWVRWCCCFWYEWCLISIWCSVNCFLYWCDGFWRFCWLLVLNRIVLLVLWLCVCGLWCVGFLVRWLRLLSWIVLVMVEKLWCVSLYWMCYIYVMYVFVCDVEFIIVCDNLWYVLVLMILIYLYSGEVKWVW